MRRERVVAETIELALEADNAEDEDVPFAYEALARAHAVAGDSAQASRHVELARAGADKSADAEDRELLLADPATIPAQLPGEPLRHSGHGACEHR